MTPYWYIENDFETARAKRIGASDVPALVPDPERPSESLAGYGRTAITLWEEKTGRREREPAGLPAEMGHWSEVKAIELFIRGIPEIGEEMAKQYVEDRLRAEIMQRMVAIDGHARPLNGVQSTPFKHNTQWYNGQFIVHPDGIYEPIETRIAGNGEPYQIIDSTHFNENGNPRDGWGMVSAHNLTIDLSRPFLIEAKSHSYFATKRRDGSTAHGYDFNLTGWQGIPMREFVQIQFQLALMDVEVCYLPLITDAAFGTFHVWEVRRDRKIGDQLIDKAAELAWHIREDKRPDHLCMNLDDVLSVYPECTDDFVILDGEAAAKAVEYASASKDAAKQEKAWKQKKDDANNALAVVLGDRKEVRVMLDTEVRPVVKWTERAGGEYVTLSECDEKSVKYLRRKGLVKEKKGSKSVNVCWKEE